MAVYGYFLFALIGRQTKESDLDIFFPFFTTLQFVFYVGWFKVSCEGNLFEYRATQNKPATTDFPNKLYITSISIALS